MKILLALAAAVALLLFGCTGVPQGSYDGLKASCEQDKALSAQDLASEKAKTVECKTQLADCANAKQAAENILAAKDAECAPLVNSASVLKDARGRVAVIEKYRNATAIYNDAYGEGKVANTAKLNKIENYVLSLNDPPLYAYWRSVRTCASISECADSKAKFLGSINETINTVAIEVVGIVK